MSVFSKSLICLCGYQFEGWFQDRGDYRRQSETGLLLCPQCGGREVHKILSPVVAVNKGQRQVVHQEGSAEPLSSEQKVQALLILPPQAAPAKSDIRGI